MIRGDTIEEKFASIEAVLRSYQRRLSTKVVGMISPVPFFWQQSVPDADGTILALLCPLQGTVVKVCIYVHEFKVSPVRLYLANEYYISSKIHGAVMTSYVMQDTEPSKVLDVDYAMMVGNIYRIRVEPTDAIGASMVSLLVQPTLTQVGQEKFMLDQMLKLEAMENARENNQG